MEPERPPIAPNEMPPRQAIWDALVSEPHTGVGIMSIDGDVLWLNEQAARIFHGPDARARDLIGKNWRDLQPPAWVDQRLRILRRVRDTGVPVIMRVIWRGYQHMTWVHHIGAEGPDANADDGQASIPDRFLTITRRKAGDGTAEELTEEPYDVVDSDVVDLGPLDALTPRELEVLALIGQGLSIKEIARVLYRSTNTIERHRDSIGTKLDVGDRLRLAEIAVRAGLTPADAARPRVDALTGSAPRPGTPQPASGVAPGSIRPR